MATELLDVPHGGIIIDDEMGVIPLCGSCLEPLFTENAWFSVCKAADHMIYEGTDKDEALRAVIDHMLDTHTKHAVLCSRGISHEIPEEP